MEASQPYIVSARKYRPASFSTVVGQGALTSTLKNAIGTGRLAQAYLFCGPRGVGKTSCARIFAKTINCLHPTADGEACGECEACRDIERGASFNIIELDAASNNSVDDIRNLTDQVNIPPQVGRYRVFIIDEVHMLSSQAFNAFLKTLEEPPSYVVFILATTEKHKVIPTILSRCQIYDFKRITIADISSHLAHVAASEGIEAEPAALDVIARKADGAMRDALSIFDQVAASSMGKITYRSAIESLNVLDYDFYFRLVEAFRNHDVPEALLIYKEIRDKGFDSLFFVNGLAGHIRDLMVAMTPRTSALLEVGDDTARQYQAQAASLPATWYWDALKLLNGCDLNYRIAGDKRLHVELCLINLCRLGMAAPMPQQQQASAVPQQSAQQQQASAQQQQALAAPRQPQQAPGVPQQPQHMQQQDVPQQRRGVPHISAPHVGAPQSGGHAAPARVRINRPQAPQGQPQAPPQRQPGTEPDPPAPSDPSPVPQGPPAPVTEQDFMDAWNRFMADNPTSRLMVSAMQMSAVRKTGDAEFEVLASNAGIVHTFSQGIAGLADYMRRSLGNPALHITVRQKAVEAAPRVSKESPRQALARIVEENRELYDLLSDLNTELT